MHGGRILGVDAVGPARDDHSLVAPGDQVGRARLQRKKLRADMELANLGNGSLVETKKMSWEGKL